MENIKATNITAGMTISYAGDTAKVVEVKNDDTGFGFDLVMDNGEEWFIFAGMTVEAETVQANELRRGYEAKIGWNVLTAKHGVITLTEIDRGTAAGTNGIVLGGLNSEGVLVWERRSRYATLIRFI